MGNLLSLDPKIHSLRTDAKKLGSLADCQRTFIIGYRGLRTRRNGRMLIHGISVELWLNRAIVRLHLTSVDFSCPRQRGWPMACNVRRAICSWQLRHHCFGHSQRHDHRRFSYPVSEGCERIRFKLAAKAVFELATASTVMPVIQLTLRANHGR